jgi:DNA invertase Pin-like site-specific DNA recombinase
MRAAEYVRVSTDLQQYSIDNQRAAIAEYAVLYNFDHVPAEVAVDD